MSKIVLKNVKQVVVDVTTQPLSIGGIATDNSDESIHIASDGTVDLKKTTTAATAAVNTNTTQLATTAFVIANSARKSTEVSATLAAASWVGASVPYTYALAVTGVTTTSNQEIDTATNRTAAQLAAYQAANIQDGGQAAGSLTLLAFGTKPTIDIPIRVILRGDK